MSFRKVLVAKRLEQKSIPTVDEYKIQLPLNIRHKRMYSKSSYEKVLFREEGYCARPPNEVFNLRWNHHSPNLLPKRMSPTKTRS